MKTYGAQKAEPEYHIDERFKINDIFILKLIVRSLKPNCISILLQRKNVVFSIHAYCLFGKLYVTFKSQTCSYISLVTLTAKTICRPFPKTEKL